MGRQDFFALSGYLIGRQVIKVLQAGTFKAAVYFALRRWARTVPTYWLVLGLFCSALGINWFSPLDTSNALFLQTINPGTSQQSIISVAWSLVIEEWSYGIISLLLMAAALTRFRPTAIRAAKSVIVICLMVTVASIIARLLASQSQVIGWDILKKTAPLQLDSLAAGCGWASLEVLRPRFFKKVTSQRVLMFFVSLVGMSGVGWWINENVMNNSQPTPTT